MYKYLPQFGRISAPHPLTFSAAYVIMIRYIYRHDTGLPIRCALF